MSAFLLEGRRLPHLFHHGPWAMDQWLDGAPKGRNETGV